MGAIIGFPSPLVRPWQDLQRLLTPCLAQERGGGTWTLGCRLTSGESHTLAGCRAHPSPSAPGSGRQDPAGGGSGSRVNCMSRWAVPSNPCCVPGAVLGAGAEHTGGSRGTAPLQIMPPACLLPAPRLQVMGRGGLPAKPFPVRPPGRGLLVPEWWVLWGPAGATAWATTHGLLGMDEHP